MAAKKDYAVGKGKPPKHSQFQKGESGNPGGKPGPRLSYERRLREAVEKAVQASTYDLKYGYASSDDVFETLALNLVFGAMKGNHRDGELLLALTAKFDEQSEKGSDDVQTDTKSSGEDGPVPKALPSVRENLREAAGVRPH